MIECYELMHGPRLAVSKIYDCDAKFEDSGTVSKVCREVFDMGDLMEEKVILFVLFGPAVQGVFELSKGNADSAIVDMQSIFTRVFLCGGKGIILAHNHPSQSRKPSKKDIEVTRKLKQACGLMDCALIDHIIVTRDGTYSFHEQGMLDHLEQDGSDETVITGGLEYSPVQREQIIYRIKELVYYFTVKAALCDESDKNTPNQCTGKVVEGFTDPEMPVWDCEGSLDELRTCLCDLEDITDFLEDMQNKVEGWQAAGINAMLDQCGAERIIPCGLTGALKGLLYTCPTAFATE